MELIRIILLHLDIIEKQLISDMLKLTLNVAICYILEKVVERKIKLKLLNVIKKQKNRMIFKPSKIWV